MSDANEKVQSVIRAKKVALFMKGSPDFPMCGFSGRAVEVFKAAGVKTGDISYFDVLTDDSVRTAVKAFTGQQTIPQAFVAGEFLGGSDDLMELYESGELKRLLNP